MFSFNVCVQLEVGSTFGFSVNKKIVFAINSFIPYVTTKIMSKQSFLMFLRV